MSLNANLKYPLNGIDTIQLDGRVDDYLSHGTDKVACLGIGVKATCNYDCVYCYAGHSDKRGNLSEQQYLDIADQAKMAGVQSIILTGAGGKSEPGLFRSIVPIIEKINSLDITPIIFSNASQFGDEKIAARHGYSCLELAEEFKRNNTSIFISCESLKPNLYETITSKPLDGFYRSIDNLLEVGYGNEGGGSTSIGISCVVMRDNFDELEKLRDFAHGYGWQFVCKFPTLAGSALDNIDMFFTPDEAKERLSVIKELRDKPETLTVNYANDSYCLVNQIGISFDNLGAPLNCLSGCSISPDTSLNLASMSLKDIIFAKKLLAKKGIGDCPKKASFYSFKNGQFAQEITVGE